MLVTLLSQDKLYGILLPEKVRGRYWIEDSELELGNPGRKILSIEGEDDVWKIRAKKRIKLFAPDSNDEVAQLELATGKMYTLELSRGDEGYLLTEPYTKDRCTFQKYSVQSDVTLNIGREARNHIVLDNPFVSLVHAQISVVGDVWRISDNNSKNGIYVNGRRLHHSIEVHPGDVAYILGVKIVFGKRFLALNNPDGVVTLNTESLVPYEPVPLCPYEAPEEIKKTIYYRSPRFYRVIEPFTLKIDEPTAREREDDTPLMLMLAPSLVMGVASFSTGLIAMMNMLRGGSSIGNALPTMIMSISMLTGMVLFPFIMKRRERNRKQEHEQERRDKYLKYLDQMHVEIARESQKQKEILNETFQAIIPQMKKGDFFERILWSRIIGQQNFLVVRVGVGNIPLQAALTFPAQRFRIDDDVMRDEVKRFSEERQIVTGVPVTYSLAEHQFSGIVGNGAVVNGILHHILIQIAALHSYDEVKLVFLCDESDLKKFAYVRWMPHIWDNDFKKRFLAVNAEEVRDMSAYFLREMEKYRGDHGVKAPHYVIVSTSKVLSDSCAFLTEILRNPLPCFSYLAVYDAWKNLPKECSMIIQINDAQGTMFDYRQTDGGQINFVPDQVTAWEASKSISQIAEYRLDLRSGKYALPEMLTFLEMYQVTKYEHLNITSRWKNSNSVASLQAPIGVNSDGGLFYLDLHEEAHGPHGLIAGMTGSGKSEFIITYVLSMAVNYSPEDVSFILIDYKGGGLVGAFESDQYRLPHIAGTITNLDGTAIARSLLSIQSELKRRQRVFAEARRIANEGTMDIYKYQKLYRSGVVEEPIPHLFIISDEFAELKIQEPEFMAQLISTARIGRSLGVHLILATQKPSGIVSDQIWANSKFKISLKVQDRADSMEMLKRPDAAELVETGRFYLQVGYNELFELGQSAWCGAPYMPSDAAVAEADERVQMIDHLGNVIEEARPQKKTIDFGNAKKQIVEIVQYLIQIAEEEHMRAKPLWLPEIPARITVEFLERKYGYQGSAALNPIIGELDDPFHQDQRLLTMPFAQKGNAVCYGNAGSGKEGLLMTVIYSLYRTNNSDKVNTYILDFGAETLQVFEDAPQTGGFMVSGEDEKITNLFQMLNREITDRKKRFASAGGDYLAYQSSAEEKIPAIVVVINEYANFAEQYETLDDQMASMTRECTKYGIYFLITNVSQIGIRYKLQQNFSQIYVLQMNDKSDYTAILGNTGGVFPSRIVGRGIYREKDVYEFQTACVTERQEMAVEAVRQFCAVLGQSDKKRAKPVPVMPKVVLERDVEKKEISFERMPIGLHMRTAMPVSVNMRRGSVGQILAVDRQDTVAFVEGLLQLSVKIEDCERYVIDPDRLLSAGEIGVEYYTDKQMEDTVQKLFSLTVERHNASKLAEQKSQQKIEWKPVMTVLMGLGQIKKLLSEDGQDMLKNILEKTNGRFGLYFWVVDDERSSYSYGGEKWCTGDGIWIGNGITDQMRLKIYKKDIGITKKMDFSCGYLVRKSKAQPVKLLFSERFGRDLEEAEDE
ncbi:MAG: type VII secretion protein EssC [Lachnospiraceae bacterium]|nr:type VII secretion protein EssC [Lachnospiraceae bacterium]